MADQTALPAGFIESLDEKTRNVVSLAVLAERQSNHEKFNQERFSMLQGDISDLKTGLDDNTKAQKSYFFWIVGILLAATGALSLLYLSGGHHAASV